MLPAIAVSLALVATGVVRAGLRAKRRLDLLPPSMFGVVDGHNFGKPDNSPFVKGGFYQDMTQYEALQILNLPANPTKQQILAHHRKAMINNHPDRGGSTFLALKINQAKEFLLKH